MAPPSLIENSANEPVPALSVVMPVHNALPYLDEAVSSILDQSFGDFEFVILDDASSDGSTERLREWAARDPRIRLLEVPDNLGPVESSNLVARAARAPIVARMDADDISYPDRLRRQFGLIEGRDDVCVVASMADVMDGEGRKVRGPEEWRLARSSPFVPFAHGAMMYRKSVFDAVGGYRKECEYWEDQDLVLRMGSIDGVLVDPDALYCVRQSVTSTRNTSSSDRLERALDLEYRIFDRCLSGEEYCEAFHASRAANDRVDPRAFVSRGSVILWSGQRPKLFGRLLKHGMLRPRVSTLTALIWTAWAELHPPSLRAFLLLLLTLRNRLAADPKRTHEPRLWRPSIRVSPAAELADTGPASQPQKSATAAK